MTQISKQLVEDLLAEDRPGEALAALRAFYAASPTLGNASFVLACLPRIELSLPKTAARIAFLRSFTLEPVAPLLRASAGLYGVELSVRFGDFNAYPQELLDPSGFLTEFRPDIVVLAVQTRDLLPELWKNASLPAQGDLALVCDRELENLRGYLTAFRARSAASVVVHTLEQPERPSAGILDSQRSDRQSAIVRRFNDGLRALAAEMTGVYLLDYDALVARYGRIRWHDEQKWLTARMPIAADCLPLLADEYLRFVLPLTGRVCKALVCDLDNTLWGGVIGEDGMSGIQVGAEYPGAAYQALQQAILDIHNRGVILAIASKNNHADALQAIEEHPGMLLRGRHFSALRVNWTDKAQNLREIARELNIGLDAVAFIDDNPVERRRIQSELPEVCVIDLPADSLSYAAALRSCPVFERLTLSAEDRERGRLYAEQRERAVLAESAASLEDFYRSLAQVVRIDRVNAQTLARAAQLTQKTNQFNMTTRRYSEPEMAALLNDPGAEVVTVQVRDRFGDNGIVGVLILRYGGTRAEIDTFLMSCRVIGRTVETAIIAEVMRRARDRGAAALRGWFLPTAKNAPAAGFYAAHGFQRMEFPTEEVMGESAQAWTYDLTGSLIERPEWIALDS